MVQSSQATFIHTDQTDQQFAITRLRAMETGRWVAVATTNGVSGLIAPDGHVIATADKRTRAVLVERLGLTSQLTPATRIGPWSGRAAMVLTVVGVLLVLLPYRRRRQEDAGPGGPPARELEPSTHGRIMTESPRHHSLGRVVMVVPTYNEADNLAWLVGRLRVAEPSVDVLVVDDNSPDGTGALADELAAADPAVHVLHRPGKGGLGAAYLAGFAWALEAGYDVVGEMDADGSHQPEQLHRLLDALLDADLVIGSRWIPGGSVVNWPRRREALSRGGNLYVRVLLGIAIKDATAGFRVFRRSALEKIDLASVESTGYVFQTDLVTRCLRAGLTVREVPIEFVERVRGDSKMSGAVAVESLRRITRWGLRERRDQVRRALRRG